MVNWIHILQDLGNIRTIRRELTGRLRITAVAIFCAVSGPGLRFLVQRLYVSLEDVTSPPRPLKEKKKKATLIECMFHSSVNHSTYSHLIKNSASNDFTKADGPCGDLIRHAAFIATPFRRAPTVRQPTPSPGRTRARGAAANARRRHTPERTGWGTFENTRISSEDREAWGALPWALRPWGLTSPSRRQEEIRLSASSEGRLLRCRGSSGCCGVGAGRGPRRT